MIIRVSSSTSVASPFPLGRSAMIDIRVLGTLCDPHTGRGRSGGRTYPAQAVCSPPLTWRWPNPAGPKSRDSLVALLWPEADDESARHSRCATRSMACDRPWGDGDRVRGREKHGRLSESLTLRRSAAMHSRCAACWPSRGGKTQSQHGAGTSPLVSHVSDAPDFENWLDNQRECSPASSDRRGVAAGG